MHLTQLFCNKMRYQRLPAGLSGRHQDRFFPSPKPPLARRNRFAPPGYWLTQRANYRQTAFSGDADCESFLSLLPQPLGLPRKPPANCRNV